MRILFLLLAVCCFSSVRADVVWSTMFIAARWTSIPVIVAGLLVEIGFVKYFAKVGWIKTIVVTILMNAVSATIGAYLIGILGAIIDIAWLFDFYTKLGMPLFHWTHFFLAYVFAVLVNVCIEGDIIKIMMKLPISKTFRWLFFANAISIGICVICLAIDDSHWISLSEAIGIPIFVMVTYGAYLVCRNFIKRK